MAERTVSMLSHKTKRGGTNDLMVWGSLVAWILVEAKNPVEILENSGCNPQDVEGGGGRKISSVQKVVRPQALEGALKPPTFIYHFFR